MGVQITLLLAEIIYVEMMQSIVPIYDSFGQTPLMLVFFGTSITLLSICLLLTTHTLFLYHVTDYEARNFSETEARVSRALAKASFQIYHHDVINWSVSSPWSTSLYYPTRNSGEMAIEKAHPSLRSS